MRIRTVKPEFWSHPVMGRMDGQAQALALGLLNLSDDEGYFQADASVVRSALRPFDDESTTTRRCIDELSRVGWIEVRKHATHGAIGRVVNFAKHQRIDRPKDSNLKQYWDDGRIDESSTTNRRIIDDESTLEGNREGKGTGKGTGNREALVPPEVQSLMDAWNAHTAPPLPRWAPGKVGPKRKRLALEGLKRRPLAEWVEVFKLINASDFCRGMLTSGTWKADVDWALTPDTAKSTESAQKVLEGKYANTKRTNAPKGAAHLNGSGDTDWSNTPADYDGAAWLAEATGGTK